MMKLAVGGSDYARGVASDAGIAERVLIVDDDVSVRTAIARALQARGYRVTTAASVREARSILEAARVSVILCDVLMPDVDGVEFVAEVSTALPDVAVVMLTGLNDATTAATALMGGALDYLVKPVETSELDRALQRALRRQLLRVERRRVEHAIRDEVAQRTMDLERERQALRDMSVGIIESLVQAMESTDDYLRGNSGRVAILAASIASEMGLSAVTVEQIRQAGRLHDVGRIGVRDSVLNKPGTLTDDEVQHLRSHLEIGVEILTPLRHLGPVLDFVQDHHEHWDGGGYPRGLRGTEISIGGRVLAAADTFQSLTSPRPHRAPLPPAKALGYMEGLSGTMLDPDVYAALRRIVARGAVFSLLEAQ